MAGSMYGKIPTRVGRAVPVRAHVAPRRLLRRLAAAVFAGTLALAFTPMAAQADPAGTVYVDCEHGDDGHGGTSAADDAVKTLSQGISLANAATGPQTLRIAAGPCHTGTTVTAITKDLTVIGAGPSAGGTLINTSGLESGHAAFTSSGDVEISVSDLAIDGSGSEGATGIQFDGGANLMVSAVEIRNISIGVSATVSGAGAATITGSTFTQIGTAAGFINGSGVNVMLSDHATATVSGNSFSENPYGGVYLAMNGTPSASITGNVVVGDTASGDWGPYGGIEVHAFSGSAGTATVSDNTVHGVDGFGILIDLEDYSGAGNASRVDVTRNVADSDDADGFKVSTTGTSSVALHQNTAKDGGADGFNIEPSDDSAVTLTDNTSSGNTGDGFTMAVSDAAQVTLERNTSSGNTGRGLSVGFDGSATGSVEVVNSTLSGNASEQAGIKSDSGSKGTVSVLFTTVTSADGSGTGLAIDENSRVTVLYSILDGGTGSGLTIGGDGLDDGHVIMDYTLVRTASQDIEDFYSESDRNIFGEDPLLGALQDNGGATRTHLPGEGSPVIDAGREAFVGAPATDQRGKPRFGSPADLGAVEVEHPKTTDTGSTGDSGSSTPSPTPTPTPTPTDSTPASETPTSGVAVPSTSVEEAGQSDDATGTTEVLGLAETGPREIGLITMLGLELLLGGIAVTLLATRRARRRHGC